MPPRLDQTSVAGKITLRFARQCIKIGFYALFAKTVVAFYPISIWRNYFSFNDLLTKASPWLKRCLTEFAVF
jgi:hypothetical protein